jgi:hypothetical protein
MAKAMLVEGFDLKVIVKITGLSEERVLQNEPKSH